MLIYAATNGYLDNTPVEQVTAWEQAFYRYMDANHPEIGQTIIEKSVLGKEKMSDDLLKKLGAAIDEFNQTAAPGTNGRAQVATSARMNTEAQTRSRDAMAEPATVAQQSPQR
jgi:F-type H+-transporting ATPase subunit alpha